MFPEQWASVTPRDSTTVARICLKESGPGPVRALVQSTIAMELLVDHSKILSAVVDHSARKGQCPTYDFLCCVFGRCRAEFEFLRSEVESRLGDLTPTGNNSVPLSDGHRRSVFVRPSAMVFLSETHAIEIGICGILYPRFPRP